jgi:hypothetical protein
MERNFAEAKQPAFLNENFNCNKTKSLIMPGNSNQSFTDRFRTWINQYTKEAKEKIWLDIESYRSR